MKSTDEPPDIPAFQGGIKKKKGSTTDAFSGVVEAFAKGVERITPHSHTSPAAANCSVSDATPGVSPAKAANLRMKNLGQLRYLHGLFEDNIIYLNKNLCSRNVWYLYVKTECDSYFVLVF